MAIKFENLSYKYSAGMPFEYQALNGISGSFAQGKINAVIGATGSGKSTLVQQLNGLLRPSSGTITIMDYKVEAGKKTEHLKELRSHVGLVFQFPETQLFEETVLKDVSFGPRNFGFSPEEIEESAKRSLTLVGIDESMWERSPLELSGGQKRRVAIAGVLASNPDILVLDEPTAGLDPQGTKEMMNLFLRLNKDYGKTIIMVTHNMDHVLHYSDTLLVLNKGDLLFNGKTEDFFADTSVIEGLGFLVPPVLVLKEKLQLKGFTMPKSNRLEDIALMIKEQIK